MVLQNDVNRKTHRIEIRKTEDDNINFIMKVYRNGIEKPIFEDKTMIFKHLIPKVKQFLKKFPDSDITYISGKGSYTVLSKKPFQTKKVA